MAYSPDPARISAPVAGSARQTIASGNMLGVAAMMTWAAGFPAAEVLLQNWPSLTIITARLIMALCVLFPLWLLVEGPSRILNANWPRALVIGGFGFGVGTYLLLVAQAFTDPVTVALVASCAPLIGAILEVRAKSRRLNKQFAFGVVASIIGGIIATSGLAPIQLGLGALCAIVATTLFTWASMKTVQAFPELGPVGRSTITFSGALLMVATLLVGSAVLGFDVTPRVAIDMEQIGMLAIYAIVAMSVSQIMFIGAVDKLGVAVATFHINTAPFYVMVIMVMLGSNWNWTQAIGAAIVGLGVVASQIQSRR
ncbi:DMT family transporter [Tropicibacter sp. Alg240-R139]|uniref:DMT family transporter n=1 Tax=Tropicibacter sp. Alg240-R139 TaxID=2305991 RepID=UPI001F081948|nr:DMT family transporter [Tropicibacter sp. Alg240-R139]